MNDRLSLCSKLVNHFEMMDVFFHWLILNVELISSRICLLTMPISNVEGLITSRWQVGCSWNVDL